MTVEDSVLEEGPVAQAEQESIGRYSARIALRCAWIVGIVLGLIILLANLDRNPIPMLDDTRSFGSLGLFAIVPITLVVAGVAFVLGVRAWNLRVAAERQRGWKVAVVPIAVAYAVLVGLLALLMLDLAEPAFPVLALDQLQAMFVVGLAGAALMYGLVTQAVQIRSSHLLRLTIIVLAAGIYLSISTSDDPLWWQISFSSVGTHGTFTSWLFNTTLVFAGLMILVWLPYFISDLDVLVRHGLTTEDKAKWVRYGLIALGISIGLVGLFENRVNELFDTIHNVAAPMMGVIVIILALSLRRLIPGFPREVYSTSMFLAITLVVGVLLVMIGYFNTTGITIYGAAVVFTWLVLFVGTVEQAAEELEPESFPT